MTRYLFILFIFVGLTVQAQEQITWFTVEQAEKLQQENPDKPLFIDVYTDWCGWCKKMDISTFQDQEVVSFLNEYFIPVKLDAEQKEDIVFNDRTYEYKQVGSRGVHELAAVILQGSLSYPSYVVMNSDGERTHLMKGYMKPNDLLNRF